MLRIITKESSFGADTRGKVCVSLRRRRVRGLRLRRRLRGRRTRCLRFALGDAQRGLEALRIRRPGLLEPLDSRLELGARFVRCGDLS